MYKSKGPAIVPELLRIAVNVPLAFHTFSVFVVVVLFCNSLYSSAHPTEVSHQFEAHFLAVIKLQQHCGLAGSHRCGSCGGLLILDSLWHVQDSAQTHQQ